MSETVVLSADNLKDPLLLREWFAVAWSREIAAGSTLARRVLGRDVVLWREADGALHCWLDLCVHRGAKLSLGVVRSSRLPLGEITHSVAQASSSCLVCPYHGWSYAGSGQCVAIPAHPGMTPPAKARAETFALQERYGVVFVRLGQVAPEVETDLPEFAIAEEPGARVMLAGPYRFRALGPRLIENFLDVAHLGIVHAGLLGDAEHGEIEDYEVGQGAHGPKADAIRVWQPDPDGTSEGATVTYQYEVLGPLTSVFLKLHGGRRFGMLAQVTPIDAEMSEMRMIMAMDYGHEVAAEELIAFQDRVAEQDRAIVESQRPELLPLDLQAELHLRSDRMAIAYRKWLRAIGFSYGVA
jgi:phenylpropionate dioxygenase-like ring-hydroxylating dioxygenase large terminal subunit